MHPERALSEARASEARWAKGEPIGPLDGVPVTIKDNIATRGHPKPVGTAAEDMSPQKVDAPPAQRLREAGAIMFTKTTMPDYGMLSSGLSSFHPLTRNPWKLDRNPGGSSAGAGAAAAAQYGPLHLGTDIGGSVRLPAGWCGIFGLKPSGGRIPIDPPYIGRVAGPMTRDVDDAALMMATLSQPDVRDYSSLKYEELDWIVEPASLKGLRVGLMMEAGCGVAPTPEVAAAVQRAARDFEAAGAHVEPLKPFLTQAMLDGLDRFWRARALSDIGALPAERRALILPFIRDWAESAADLSGVEVFRGFDQIPTMRKAAIDATAPFDCVLSPTAPMTAFPAEWAVAQPRSAAIRFRTSASPSPSTCPSSRRPRSIVVTIPRACRSGCRSSAVDLTILACWRSPAPSRPFGRSKRGRGRSLPRPDRVARRDRACVVCRYARKRVKGAASRNVSRYFSQQGGRADEKVHGSLHGECSRL